MELLVRRKDASKMAGRFIQAPCHFLWLPFLRGSKNRPHARLTFLFKTDPRVMLWDTKIMSWNKISYILAIKTNTYSAGSCEEYPFETDN